MHFFLLFFQKKSAAMTPVDMSKIIFNPLITLLFTGACALKKFQSAVYPTVHRQPKLAPPDKPDIQNRNKTNLKPMKTCIYVFFVFRLNTQLIRFFGGK